MKMFAKCLFLQLVAACVASSAAFPSGCCIDYGCSFKCQPGGNALTCAIAKNDLEMVKYLTTTAQASLTSKGFAQFICDSFLIDADRLLSITFDTNVDILQYVITLAKKNLTPKQLESFIKNLCLDRLVEEAIKANNLPVEEYLVTLKKEFLTPEELALISNSRLIDVPVHSDRFLSFQEQLREYFSYGNWKTIKLIIARAKESLTQERFVQLFDGRLINAAVNSENSENLLNLVAIAKETLTKEQINHFLSLEHWEQHRIYDINNTDKGWCLPSKILIDNNNLEKTKSIIGLAKECLTPTQLVQFFDGGLVRGLINTAIKSNNLEIFPYLISTAKEILTKEQMVQFMSYKCEPGDKDHNEEREKIWTRSLLLKNMNNWGLSKSLIDLAKDYLEPEERAQFFDESLIEEVFEGISNQVPPYNPDVLQYLITIAKENITKKQWGSLVWKHLNLCVAIKHSVEMGQLIMATAKECLTSEQFAEFINRKPPVEYHEIPLCY